MKAKTIILSLLIPFFLIGCTTNTNNNNQPNNGTDPNSSDVEPNNGTEPNSSNTEPNNNTEDNIPVTSVNLNKPSLELYEDDSSYLLTATILPSNATNKAVNWSSSNPSVATIYEGSITPVGVGTTVIRVTSVDGNKVAECNVTVRERVSVPNYVLHGTFNGSSEWTDKQMTINQHSTSEYMIQGVSLHANDVFKIHMYGDTWYGYSALKSSVNFSLVTQAPSDDNIKVLTTGIYDIYCDYNASFGGHIYLARVDESTPISSNVSVTGISLSHSGKFLLTRNEFTITPTIYPSNATNQRVWWSSSDTSIATVYPNGRVEASVNSKVGTTTITARTEDGNYTATCIVYVSASQYPAYCLTGTIGGRSYSGISSRYAAIPLGTNSYLIPDVELVDGDEITVTGNNGARLMNKYNQVYKKSVSGNMSVNIYLNPNDSNKNYLTFSPKSGN